jgi:adenosylcobinamide-GDP ribazoletransferase
LPANQEWQAFWLAVGFLTRIPMLVRIDYSPQLMNQCSVYFPVVGLILGVLYATLYAAIALIWSPWVCVILVTGFHLWITGAFHEDGLADSADGLGGGYTVEARLRIMKDSRIGTYGTVALVMALLLKVTLLSESSPIWLALLIAPCVARLTPLMLMRFMSYVSDPGSSKSKLVADSFSTKRLVYASVFVILICGLLTPWAPALILFSAVSIGLVGLLWGRQLNRDLGGYTGDALGASVIFTELILLALLAAWL